MIQVPSVVRPRILTSQESKEKLYEHLAKEPPLKVLLSKRHRTHHLKVFRELKTYCGQEVDRHAFLVAWTQDEVKKTCLSCERAYGEATAAVPA